VIDHDDRDWWRTAVIYQVYPRSFADADGDGAGDLRGITDRLGHVAGLGADAVWLSPFYPSPQVDGGYDVADYRDVDPVYGTLEDAQALFERAHDLGVRVIVDLVPNHCSRDHDLFRTALAAPPGSAERAMFHFRAGRGPRGDLPPNDWVSMFGGPAWTRTTDAEDQPGQWYLHLFDPGQPDWNWDEPRVRAEFELTLRFWLDRGVDGFRVDVCDAMVKAPGLPDWPYPTHGVVESVGGRMPPMWDQEGIHEIFRSWRRLLDDYAGTRILCAEAWLPPERTARIVRPDEMHQAFNFTYLSLPWDATAIRDAVVTSMAADDAVGAPTTWVLSNHDVMRHASRYGYEGRVELEAGVGADDPQPDQALGLRRARAATLLMLALPGSAYLYQGEELGLPEVTTLPDSVRRDPVWERSGHSIRGRDGCRVPLPWVADGPCFGFSVSGDAWLPQPGYFAGYAVDVQNGDPRSTLTMYRRALALRKELALGAGTVQWLEIAPEVVAWVNCRTIAVGNLGPKPVRLPAGEVLISSDAAVATGTMLPPDTSVWMTVPTSADI